MSKPKYISPAQLEGKLKAKYDELKLAGCDAMFICRTYNGIQSAYGACFDRNGHLRLIKTECENNDMVVAVCMIYDGS